jgi:hypothetical protein
MPRRHARAEKTRVGAGYGGRAARSCSWVKMTAPRRRKRCRPSSRTKAEMGGRLFLPSYCDRKRGLIEPCPVGRPDFVTGEGGCAVSMDVLPGGETPPLAARPEPLRRGSPTGARSPGGRRNARRFGCGCSHGHTRTRRRRGLTVRHGAAAMRLKWLQSSTDRASVF